MRAASAVINFKVPVSAGTSPVTSYTVTVHGGPEDGSTYSGPGTQYGLRGLQLPIPSLTIGQSYTFTVNANNNAGVGEPSAPSNTLIPSLHPHVSTSADVGPFCFDPKKARVLTPADLTVVDMGGAVLNLQANTVYEYTDFRNVGGVNVIGPGTVIRYCKITGILNWQRNDAAPNTYRFFDTYFANGTSNVWLLDHCTVDSPGTYNDQSGRGAIFNPAIGSIVVGWAQGATTPTDQIMRYCELRYGGDGIHPGGWCCFEYNFCHQTMSNVADPIWSFLHCDLFQYDGGQPQVIARYNRLGDDNDASTSSMQEEGGHTNNHSSTHRNYGNLFQNKGNYCCYGGITSGPGVQYVTDIQWYSNHVKRSDLDTLNGIYNAFYGQSGDTTSTIYAFNNVFERDLSPANPPTYPGPPPSWPWPNILP